MAKKIDARALVAHLGGPTELRRKLERIGHEISLKGINMWVYRDRIPGPWLVTIATEMGANLKRFTVDASADDAQDLDFLQ